MIRKTGKHCLETFPYDGIRLGCSLSRAHKGKHRTRWAYSGYRGRGFHSIEIWWRGIGVAK